MRALQVDAADNVAVVLQRVRPGDPVRIGTAEITAAETIEKGHKIALRDIGDGDMIRKYGVPIGQAVGPIPQGAWVHTHNVNDITQALCEEYAREFRARMETDEDHIRL